ncbi:GNAT family N-acetyltransferase [Paenibacillus caui]|uniref:GNAT family N-acetyltransferase n=1 Tax=Paenibacillus caui TaxID=2873927 RepID=UPI001CA9B06D|nr:GNAT family protein [Paenibacillus caui]
MGHFEPIGFADKQGCSITLRAAAPDDAGKVLNYVFQILSMDPFMLTTPVEFKMTEEDEREWIGDTLKKENDLILLAEDEHGEVAGLINLHGGHKRRMAHTGSFGISVRRDLRGRGIGKGMIQALLEWANRNRQFEKITLEVFSTNHAAIALYRHMGFEQESLQKRQIKLEDGEYVDLIGMGLFLKK